LPYQYITQPFYAHYRIAGGTGSGKTTVVHQIMNELPDTEGIISQDSYYKENHNLSFDERFQFDHPRAIDFALLVAHLKELREQKTIQPFILLSLITEQKTPLLPTQKSNDRRRDINSPELRDL
jgi:uridine kinase